MTTDLVRSAEQAALVDAAAGTSLIEEQAALLHAAGLLSEAGLAHLLDEAAFLVRSDPRRGRSLATLVGTHAAAAGAPALAPRAHYLCARAYAANAEHDAAIAHIAAARSGYLACGEPLEALRTNVGLMNILRDQGRYAEALHAGQAVVDGVADLGPEAADDASRLVALARQNVGLCYEQMGRYDAALAAYDDAEARYRQLGMDEQIGEIANNRGIVLLALGRAGDALNAFSSAASRFADAGLTLLHATTLINIGDAHLLLGHYSTSLAAFEHSRRLLATLDAQADTHVLALDTADAYLALNRYPEAVAAYREADRQLLAARMPFDRARALWGMGSALLAQGQLDAAADALDAAGRLFGAADNAAMRSNVLLEQAALQALRGERAEALALARQALALCFGYDLPVQQTYAHMRLADLLLPDLAAAEEHLLAAQPPVELLGLPHLRYRLRQRLGHLRLRQGRRDEARLLLSAAIDEIERVRGALASEAARSSFLHDKTAAYEDLVRLHLDGSDPWEAFAVAERAKSRALLDLLAGVEGQLAARLQADDATLGVLGADLHAAYTELLGSAGDPERAARVPALRERAATLERQIALLRLRHDAHAPPDPLAAPLSAPALQARLPTDGPLLAYHIIGNEIMAFVWDGATLHTTRHLADLPTVQGLMQRLHAQWDRFRAGPDFVRRHLAVLEESARRILGELYAALVAPVAPLLATASAPGKLAIIPHGLLHQTPFHALYDGTAYLIDRYEIVYAPSVAVLALTRERPPADGHTLLVGVADPLIPAVADEVAAISRLLPLAETLSGERATLDALRERAPGCGVLHLACHGLFRDDNPIFSALHLADGWLTAAEIARLDLRGTLVALSACESGRGGVFGGDEVIGLARAFVAAGARTLLVSLWLAQDTTTAALMEGWYTRMCAGASPAAALRAAQLALREHERHPFYWAPFILVGQR